MGEGRNSLEPLDELNRRRFARSRWSDDRSELSRLDFDVETAQDSDVRARRVAEVNVFESNVTLGLREVELFTRGIFGVDLGTRVDEGHESRRGSTCFRHVGHEGEDVSSLDRAEDDAADRTRVSHLHREMSARKRGSYEIIATKKSRCVTLPSANCLAPYLYQSAKSQFELSSGVVER